MIQYLMTPAGVGTCLIALALATLVYAAISPGQVRLSLERRRLNVGHGSGALARGATAATGAIGRVLERRADVGADTILQRAGVKTRPQDFVFLVGIGALVAATLGLLAGGPLLAVLLAAFGPILVRLVLALMVDRRKAAFADQLDDSLQLMAGALRAGHSILQALDSVAAESEEPTSEEFARIINETRMGRELNASLRDTARRMGSEDFSWVTQAIAINREVGGNLAEVLDGVGHTIRERNEIRRQVKTLAAEGKLSAIVLMLLPVGIVGFLTVANPEYIGRFTESILGYGLIIVAIVLLLVGGIWLRKTVNIKF
ncbi:type II secretion system F family protein [Georgenia sp. SUBG003]|uniref:type II secretion system F family protein n=2 Tax=Georgenia sp. SUBG003 TaxID=1497974 RepID=UPI0004D5CEB4|nr:type II secretion system protein F [Georgenia sp. SUBG003]